ncbi:MAG TPA: methyltransferase [Methanocorpusculum sp.]|nr:methyltransferase [Methanocorpusculum sp.]
MTEQWGIRILLSEGETVRKKLIVSGLADRTLRPRVEDGFLVIPVVKSCENAVKMDFNESSVREELPRHEQIGGLVILQEDDVEGAKKILKNRSSAHTALFATSPVMGEFRTRTFKVLAGEDTTQTLYTEYGKRMVIDISVAYFSARFSDERQRLAALVRVNECILDMFAGVGPFAVTLGSKAAFMVCNDINLNAVYLMQQNLKMNRIKSVVAMVGDAKNLPEMLSGLKFDRIIMNLPFTAYEFLEVAAKLAKPSCTIHLYSLVNREGEHLEDINRIFPSAKVTEKSIRSYSPTSWHVVYDVIIG